MKTPIASPATTPPTEMALLLIPALVFFAVALVTAEDTVLVVVAIVDEGAPKVIVFVS